jgi:hypothetical protein
LLVFGYHYGGVVFIVILALLLVVLNFFRRSRQPKNQLRIWQCCRYQGGANVFTPRPMTEEQALEFASHLGSVLWVDRHYGFIFYRPPTGL